MYYGIVYIQHYVKLRNVSDKPRIDRVYGLVKSI